MVRYVLSVTTDKLTEKIVVPHQGDTAYELMDFSDSRVLDNKALVLEKVRGYLQLGLPTGSIMMGAFEDLSIFSRDDKIRAISFGRMRQCLKIAQKLALDAVVFYLNIPRYLEKSSDFLEILSTTCEQLSSVLEAFPEVRVCFENRLEPSPKLFVEIFERLKKNKNIGFCLNYSRAALSCAAPEK